MLMARIKITLIYLTIRTTQPSLSTQPDYKDEPHRTTFNGRKLKSNHLNYIFNISKLHLKETQNPGFLPSQQILRFFFFFFFSYLRQQNKVNIIGDYQSSILFFFLCFRFGCQIGFCGLGGILAAAFLSLYSFLQEMTSIE